MTAISTPCSAVRVRETLDSERTEHVPQTERTRAEEDAMVVLPRPAPQRPRAAPGAPMDALAPPKVKRALRTIGAEVGSERFRARTARRAVLRTSSGELSNLSLSQENQLIEAMAADGLGRSDRKAIRKLYESLTRPEGFERMDREAIGPLVEAVRESGLLRQSDDYATMSLEQRQDVAQRMHRVVSEALGLPRSDLKFVHLEDAPEFYGVFFHHVNTIHVNTGSEIFGRFDDVLKTVVHENLHHVQFIQGTRFFQDPRECSADGVDDAQRCEAARSFAQQLRYYSNEPGSYETQPMEDHARRIAATVIRELRPVATGCATR